MISDTFTITKDARASVDLLFIVLVALSAAVMLILGTLVLWFCVRYRASSPAPRTQRIMRVSWFEASWISATLVGFLGVSVWANAEYFTSRSTPVGAYTVYAVGKRWMWKIEHPSGRREVNTLHVPAGEPVRVVLTSDDVIHSLYLPQRRTKQDALPGRYTSLWFVAPGPGEEPLFCAEYCGAEHSNMIGRVIALSRPDFDRWLAAASSQTAPDDGAQPPETTTPMRGRLVFRRAGCGVCHLGRARIPAPRLDGIWGRQTRLVNGDRVIVDEAYVRESILRPNAKIVAGYEQPSTMPAYAGSLGDEEIDALVEFMRVSRHGFDDSAGGEP